MPDLLERLQKPWQAGTPSSLRSAVAGWPPSSLPRTVILLTACHLIRYGIGLKG